MVVKVVGHSPGWPRARSRALVAASSRLGAMSDPAVEAQQRIWTIGDYPVIARHLLPISIDTVAALGIGRGDEVLDVGVGTGNAAVEAARRGAHVTGIDLTPAQIERARARCAEEGVEVDLRVGDAQSLEVPDASFDFVLSVMGVIFAPDHERAAAEMARVCRPGGTVAITSWKDGGWSSRWRVRASQLVPAPPPGAPMPDAWGDPEEVVRRLSAAGLETNVVERSFAFRFPSIDNAIDVFLSAAGPFVQFMEMAAAQGNGEEALRELRDALEEAKEPDDGNCVLPAPYLLATARRPTTWS